MEDWEIELYKQRDIDDAKFKEQYHINEQLRLHMNNYINSAFERLNVVGGNNTEEHSQCAKSDICPRCITIGVLYRRMIRYKQVKPTVFIDNDYDAYLIQRAGIFRGEKGRKIVSDYIQYLKKGGQVEQLTIPIDFTNTMIDLYRRKLTADDS